MSINDPIFVQTPKTGAIAFGAATQSTQMDPATVAPTTLLTAGANGAIVTSVEILAEATVAAEKFVLWVQLLGAGNWYALRDVLMASYTMAAATAQGKTTLVDKLDLEDRIRLAATDVLGVTHHIDQQSIVVAEFSDY